MRTMVTMRVRVRVRLRLRVRLRVRLRMREEKVVAQEAEGLPSRAKEH